MDPSLEMGAQNQSAALSSSSPSTSSFWSLPNEMRTEIFEHLDLDAKRSSRLVCHAWTALLNQMMELSPILSDTTVATVIAAASSSLPIVSLRTRRLQDPRSIPELRAATPGSRRSSLRSAGLPSPLSWLDNVTHIIVGEHSIGISEANLQKILCHCSVQLEIMEFEERTLKNVTRFHTIWSGLSFGQLTHLRILLNTYEPNHYRAVESLLGSQSFPQLSDLRISFTDIQTPTYHHPVEPYTRLFNTVYTFVGRHNRSLTNLWLNEAEELLLDPAVEGPQPIAVTLSDSTIQELGQLNLTRLRLFLGNFDQNHPEWPANCLASNHTQLVTLDVWGAPVPREFFQTILNNVKTLKYLYWTSDYVEVDGDADAWSPPAHAHGPEYGQLPLNVFDVSILAQATALVHLDLSANKILNFTALPTQIERLVWSSDLTTDQLIWIATNLKLLRILIVEENSDNETEVPYISLEVLKLVLAMAGRLELFKLYGVCEKEPITEFCTSVQGLAFEGRPDSVEEDQLSRIKDRPGFRLEIDRNLLDPKDLE